MARALPFHVRQLFALMPTLGYSQTQCAEALGLSRQAVNNWACGWNVPAKYRRALASLVTLAIHRALAEATRRSPEALETLTRTIDRAVGEWFLENQDARGGHDGWHSALGHKLAMAFKTPLSEQGVEAWKTELALHLEAANVLRGLIQRHEMAPPARDLRFRPPEESPGSWFWWVAGHLAGEPLDKSAALTQWEDHAFQQWMDSLPVDKRAGLEAMRQAGAQKTHPT